MNKRPIPVDVSTFSTLINKGYLYVDKTRQILNLFNTGRRYFFLSRPRRFGKTLLISTLKSLFSGDKKLFKDLWIGKQKKFEWQEHPVIHLDFSQASYSDPEKLKKSLCYMLDRHAEKHGVDISKAFDAKSRLALLVELLARKNSVVILVDEYDKPILDNIHDRDKAEQQREVLKEFYDGFKALDEYLRCIFITGVSKFSKTSVFSGLNNLTELSYLPEACDIVGYTQEEVEQNFDQYIKDYCALKNTSFNDTINDIQSWYNGYRFSREPVKVYNPYSLAYFFTNNRFANYWFESGTPAFLVELLKKKPLKLREIESKMVTLSSLGTFRLEDLPLETLFFQTGYLTIQDYDERFDVYRIGYPNEEIKQSLSILEMGVLTSNDPIEISSILYRLRLALVDKDVELFVEYVRSLLARIPFNLHIDREAYYHSLIQLLCNLLGFENHCELATSKGRADLVLVVNKYIYIIEFKFNKIPEAAVQQILDKKYYERFLSDDKEIIPVGISFSHKNKRLDIQWKEGTLSDS